MNEEHPWHIELVYMRDKIYWALNDLDDLSKRDGVKGQLEAVLGRLKDLCEATKGESK